MSQPYNKSKYPGAFPVLSSAQIDSIAQFINCVVYEDGQILLKAGKSSSVFHIIKKGTINVIDESGHVPKLLLQHAAGEFTGDLANLSGRTSNLTAVALGEVEAYEVRAKELRAIIRERPTLGDIFLTAFMLRSDALKESDFTGIRIIGKSFSPDPFRVRRFLAKNKVLSTWIDADNDAQVNDFLKNFEIKEADFPIVAHGSVWILHNPSNYELARKLGIMQNIREGIYDLAIVGGGPAGLTAAVYGSSEGLDTILLERHAPGGQAGTSSKIENYLGFPTGISGGELASRANIQAEKFGAQISIPALVKQLTIVEDIKKIELDTGEVVKAKAVIIASGAEYRRLEVSNLSKYEGKGVYYAATALEETLCIGQNIAIVGGGNSAGQAAMFLSQTVKNLYLIIRGDDLGRSMSEYLVKRIQETKNITLFKSNEISALAGDGHLNKLTIANNQTGKEQTLEVVALFSFIGALPLTSWLPSEIEKDSRGFIKTDADIEHWNEERPAYVMETSIPGLFAVGDVRSGSSKRVSSAVGEGSIAVQFVHRYIAQWDEAHKSKED